jgi:hypothetical protein
VGVPSGILIILQGFRRVPHRSLLKNRVSAGSGAPSPSLNPIVEWCSSGINPTRRVAGTSSQDGPLFSLAINLGPDFFKTSNFLAVPTNPQTPILKIINKRLKNNLKIINKLNISIGTTFEYIENPQVHKMKNCNTHVYTPRFITGEYRCWVGVSEPGGTDLDNFNKCVMLEMDKICMTYGGPAQGLQVTYPDAASKAAFAASLLVMFPFADTVEYHKESIIPEMTEASKGRADEQRFHDSCVGGSGEQHCWTNSQRGFAAFWKKDPKPQQLHGFAWT